MRKQFVLGVLILALATALTACGNKTEASISSGNATESAVSNSANNSIFANNDNVMGNTNGNLVNGGQVAISGEWIYYSSSIGIYRMKDDGTEKETLYLWNENGQPVSLNVVGEWIYYKNLYPFKMKIDGTEQQQISDPQYSGSFRVIGDWMYFGSEYKMKTDGSNLQQIYDKNGAPGMTVNIVDNWIYYYDSDNEGNDSIFRMKTDGTDKQKIYSGRTDMMVVYDGWIYYEDHNSRDLYKMKTDGSGSQLLSSEQRVLSLNVVGDWIFYGGGNEAGNRSLSKIKTDGSEKQILCGDNATDICIIGDWVYYVINGGEYIDGERVDRIYRIRTDGSGKEAINIDSQEGSDATASTSQESVALDENQLYTALQQGDFSYFAGTYKPCGIYHEMYGGGEELPNLILQENGTITGGLVYGAFPETPPTAVTKNEDGSYKCQVRYSDDKSQDYFLIYPKGSIGENPYVYNDPLLTDTDYIQYKSLDGGVLDIIYYKVES